MRVDFADLIEGQRRQRGGQADEEFGFWMSGCESKSQASGGLYRSRRDLVVAHVLVALYLQFVRHVDIFGRMI